MTRETAPALKAEAERLAADLVAWRRDLHRHPELGFEEKRTAGFVAARLEELGLELRTGVAVTGVVGLLRAPRHSGPAVLLRADMDALPIDEIAGREYGSTVPGRMHACGHDGHVAMLLGAAVLLAQRREALSRDVVFCFQPGEEGRDTRGICHGTAEQHGARTESRTPRALVAKSRLEPRTRRRRLEPATAENFYAS